MSPRNHLLRLSAFALLAGALAYLSINFGLAWGYAYVLTHPGCRANPPPLNGLPSPQEISLESSDGLTLRAWYYPSQNGIAVLALGGPGGALDGNLPPVDFLIEEGYGALQIDSRACAKPTTPVTLGGKEMLDAESGLAFLLDQTEVKQVVVFGFSMGGVTAIRCAARHPEIAAVIAEGGFFNLGDDFVEPLEHKSIPRSLFLYSVAATFWLNSGQNPWQISPIDDLPRISPRPVFLIFGEHEAASGRAAAQYQAAREPKQLWIVPDGTHGGNYRIARQEYQEQVNQFLRIYLNSN